MVLCIIKYSFSMHVKNYLVNEWCFYFPHCIFILYKMHGKAKQNNFGK